MEQQPILDPMDPEFAEAAVSRRDLLRGAGKLARGLAYASAPVAALGVTAQKAAAQSSGLTQQVVDVLNFALTLEYLESEFYNMGVGTSGLIPAQFLPVFKVVQEHENQHVALLKSVLGSLAVAKPAFDFTAGGRYFNVFTSFGTFVALSQAFEDTGVRAYKGQATKLMSNKPILTAALQIHSVEARHAGEIRAIRGNTPWIIGTGSQTDIGASAIYQGEDKTIQYDVDVPAVAKVPAFQVSAAFDEPLTMEQVLAIVAPFIRS